MFCEASRAEVCPVEVEASRADRFDIGAVAQDDECAGSLTENQFDRIAQWRTRSECPEDLKCAVTVSHPGEATTTPTPGSATRAQSGHDERSVDPIERRAIGSNHAIDSQPGRLVTTAIGVGHRANLTRQADLSPRSNRF